MADDTNIFLKKIWEFHPKDWPIAGYSQKGLLKPLFESNKPKNLILFCITQSSRQIADRGKLIGLAEFENKTVRSLDYVSSEVEKQKHNYNKNGRFKWPYAVRLTKAWELTERPFYKIILKNNKAKYNKFTRTGSIALEDEDVKIILALARKEVPLGIS